MITHLIVAGLILWFIGLCFVLLKVHQRHLREGRLPGQYRSRKTGKWLDIGTKE